MTVKAWFLLLNSFLLAACASQTRLPEGPPSYVILEGPSKLADAVETDVAAHEGLSAFYLLASGEKAFATRALLAEQAERSIDLQYYIAKPGLTSRLLTYVLIKAADRGVRVRILLDDTAIHGRDDTFVMLSAHPNIEVRVFNPVAKGRGSALGRATAMLTNFDRMHRRMHNKLWLVDNAIGITGGRNLGDEYFAAASEVNFSDIDVMAAGPVVHEMSVSFDAYWNNEAVTPITHIVDNVPDPEALDQAREYLKEMIDSAELAQSPYIAQLTKMKEEGRFILDSNKVDWANGETLWDLPEKITSVGKPEKDVRFGPVLYERLTESQRRLVIVSPYFVPGKEGVAALAEKVRQGVRVIVLTNSLAATDVPVVYGAYAPYRLPLLNAGVEIYEMKPQQGKPSKTSLIGSSAVSLHAKVMLFDGATAFVGTLNFDPRSVLWNTEVGVMIHSETFVSRLNTELLPAFKPENSYRLFSDEGEVRFESLEEGELTVLNKPPAGLWRRLQSWFSEKVGPESLM